MAIDKSRFESYIYNLNSFLKQESFYDSYIHGISKGKNNYNMTQRFQKKIFDLDWVEAVEEAVIALDTIVRNPRKFIQQEEDIVDISLARSISTESVKHLAQHTNFISSVTKDGMVIPSKILNITKEESFEIYENRFIYTLILKVHQFLTKRWEMVKSAAATSDTFSVNIESDYSIEESKIKCNMETVLQMPLDDILKADDAQLTDVQRVAKMVQIVNGFLSSPFAKVMVSCALVRPPIIRTNVILKDPNFKKALVLWQFIDTYGQVGFEVKSVNETAPLPPTAVEKYNNLIYLNNIVLETLVRARLSDTDIVDEAEQKKKEKHLADEYVTKNIDDFVPDDFPQLKLTLFETRRIFTKIPMTSDVTREETTKITKCIDRCLLQYKINKAKQDAAEQIRLDRLLEQQEIKAKVDALKEAKALEKKKAKDAIKAEKDHARQEKLNIKLEKDRLARETADREARLRREEEENTRRRIEQEKAEARERILEEQERLKAVFDAEKARVEIEKAQLREQLEREKAMAYIAPLEQEAMLKLRKKEQIKLMQMRADQELALKQMITAHYQDMEAQQKQSIIDMEELADILNYDIFDDDAPKKQEPVPEDEVIPDVPEMDLSLTTKDEKGVTEYEKKKGFVAEEPEPEPEVEVKPEVKKELTEATFAPRSAEERLAELEKNEVGVTEEIKADKIMRPSKKLAEAPKILNLEDEWDFDMSAYENKDKKEDNTATTSAPSATPSAAPTAKPKDVSTENAQPKTADSSTADSDLENSFFAGKAVTPRKSTDSAAGAPVRTFVPRSYTTINVTPENAKEVLKDVGGTDKDDEKPDKSKKGLFGRKKK